jgi:LacI family transcriptional regulator
VSLALRGDSSIPPATRQRILAVADNLNYDYVPQSKKVGSVRVLRIVFVVKNYGDRPATTNPFYGYILAGAEQICRERNASFSFVVLPHDYPVAEELPVVLRHDADGILLTSPYPMPLITRISQESGCPIVLIDNIFPGSPFDSVMADDFGGGYQATEHLIRAGHTRIVVVTARTGNPDIPPSYQQRYAGYCAACAAAGIRPLPPAVIPAVSDQDIPSLNDHAAFRTWVRGLLQRSPNPTAIFGVGDTIAMRVLATLRDIGVAVPQHCSVVGFDDLEHAKTANPPLTTIRPHKRMLARVAVEQLLARIAQKDSPPHYIRLGTELVARESSGPAPAVERED